MTWTPVSLGTLTATRPIGARVGLTVDHPGQIGGRPARGQRFEGTLEALERSELSRVYYEITIGTGPGSSITLNLPLDHRLDIDEMTVPVRDADVPTVHGVPITPEGHVDDVGCWCGPMVHPVAGLMHTLPATGPTGAALIAAERRRQIDVEEWTEAHDRGHGADRLAAAAYAYQSGDRNCWPWASSWWKPKNRLRDLIRAGALYQAAADLDPVARQRLERDRDNCARLVDELLAEARAIDGTEGG